MFCYLFNSKIRICKSRLFCDIRKKKIWRSRLSSSVLRPVFLWISWPPPPLPKHCSKAAWRGKNELTSYLIPVYETKVRVTLHFLRAIHTGQISGSIGQFNRNRTIFASHVRQPVRERGRPIKRPTDLHPISFDQCVLVRVGGAENNSSAGRLFY